MLAFCFAIFAVFGVVLVLVGANQDALAGALGLRLAESGLLTSLLALGIGSGNAIGGPLADRLPRRALSGSSVLLAVLALLSVEHDTSFARLGVQIFVLGVGAGVANVVFNVVVIERYGDQAARRLLVLHSAATLGAIAGPGLVVVLGDPGLWTPSFRAIGAAYLALGVWLLFVPLGAQAGGSRAGASVAIGRRGQRLTLAAYCVAAFAYLGAEAAVTVFTIPYADALGLSGNRGRAAISAFWLGLLAGRLCVLLYRGSLDARLLVASGLAGTATLVTAALQLTTQIEWVLGLAGFALGPVFPLLVALGARTLPLRPGLATGWLTGIGALGGFTLPWITGEIGDRTTVGAVFAALAVCTLLLAAAAAAAHRLRERHAPGLCGSCRHARRIGNQRGSEFWQCQRAESDPAFRRYPELPVDECAGHEPGEVLL